MRVVVVSRVGTQRRVHWGALILVAAALGLFGAAVAGGLYYALARTVSPIAVGIGFLGAVVAVCSGAYRAWRLPIASLTPSDNAEPATARF